MNSTPAAATSRRNFIKSASVALAASAFPRLDAAEVNLPNRLYTTEDVTHGKKSLFDGVSLKGWRAVPRLDPAAVLAAQGDIPYDQLMGRVMAHYRGLPNGKATIEHVGKWEVKDGAIIGGQAVEGAGAYLITEEKFTDFELEFEANHDWPVDSGVLFRQHEMGALGYQLAVETRPRGSNGGFYVNGIGNFRSPAFYVDALELPNFKYTQLTQGVHDSRPMWPLDYAAHFEDFLPIWKPNDWNRFRVRCVGKVPTITSWINGLKIASLNFGAVWLPGFNPERAAKYLGNPGHIGLEVHSSGPEGMGRNRWAPGAVTRWRNITVQPL
jgi:hypothetical protein